MKKLGQVTVRLGEEDMEYLAQVAGSLRLPTDDRLNLSRAVQMVLLYMRTSVGAVFGVRQGIHGGPGMRALPPAPNSAGAGRCA